jgi:hypothetical protein
VTISFASSDRAHAKILCIRAEADVLPTALDRGLIKLDFSLCELPSRRLKRSDAAGDEDEALRQLLRLRRDKRKHDSSAIAKADPIMPMNPAPARAFELG